MPKYVFTFGGFHINNTMAAHTDTDWVYFTVKAGKTVIGPRHQKIGDLNNGDYVLNWPVGPVEINDNDSWLMTYQIVNNGHDDDAAQLEKDQKIAGEIGAGVAAVAGAINVGAGAVVAAIAGIVEGIIQIFKGFRLRRRRPERHSRRSWITAGEHDFYERLSQGNALVHGAQDPLGLRERRRVYGHVVDRSAACVARLGGCRGRGNSGTGRGVLGGEPA